jgi:hypothetical protein
VHGLNVDIHLPVDVVEGRQYLIFNRDNMAGPVDRIASFLTEKGKDAITFRGHCYRLDRSGADGLYWRCLKDNCRGRIMTDFTRNNPQYRTEHNHPADFDTSKVREVRENLRKRAHDETTTPIPVIYQQETRTLANHPLAAAKMPGYPSVNATMYRERHSTLPPLPPFAQ